MLCLQEFIGHCGKPNVIYSDNDMQFKLISSAIEKLWTKALVDGCIVYYISNENIREIFIIERAHGWEAFRNVLWVWSNST